MHFTRSVLVTQDCRWQGGNAILSTNIPKSLDIAREC
jgi:hypothetical protein